MAPAAGIITAAWLSETLVSEREIETKRLSRDTPLPVSCGLCQSGLFQGPTVHFANFEIKIPVRRVVGSVSDRLASFLSVITQRV